MAGDHEIYDCFTGSLARAKQNEAPYRHWLLDGLLPDWAVKAMQIIDLPLIDLNGVSGKRELHNGGRHYFNKPTMAKYGSFKQISEAFQAPQMVAAIEQFFQIDLEDSLLRIEYAQDTEEFWLQPHTDLGVKKLTVLIYISNDPGHDALGTDIYAKDKSWAARSPFAPNMALAFVPGEATYHGFERRNFQGVRKSLILNYVTQDWRDRDQLAFPERPIASRDQNAL